MMEEQQVGYDIDPQNRFNLTYYEQFIDEIDMDMGVFPNQCRFRVDVDAVQMTA
jgi:hypothetical protein